MNHYSINFELYKIFYYAASSLNFSKAAFTLHVTQSAVSQAIKSLETQLGINLFYRNGRNIKLSYEGEILYQHVEKAFNFIRSAEHSMNSIRVLDEGTVFIGASDTITRYFLMPSIKAFHQDYPKVKIVINNRPSPRSVEKLSKGEIDLAIVNISPSQTYEGLDLFTLTSLEHIFISKSPLAPKKHALAELSQFPLICLETKSTTRRILESHYEKCKVPLTPAFEFGSFDVILEAVNADMGIGFVPRQIVSDALKTEKYYEIKTTQALPSIDIGILSNQNKPLSIAAQTYLERLKNTPL